MASKRDIEIASLLYRSGIVSQEDIQSALGYQGKLLTEGTVRTLVEILVERELLPEDSVQTFSEEPIDKIQPFPDYQLLEQTGDGASARVFRGTYKPRELQVAVKVLHPEQELQPKSLKRFMQEAHLLCKLRHPNIVRGYEVRKINGLRFLSMQWIEGGTVLEAIDKRGRLDGPTALHVTRQIASALSYLHDNGIVHRDIKPGNVLGDHNWNVWLIDLGLCHFMGRGSSGESAGTTVGTVGYISPEQAKGAGDLDIRSDIYSLGVSLYHMVAGEVPFSGDDDFEVMSKQIMQSLRSDRLKSLNISPNVHYAIEKMMAKDREIRYQHPEEIVKEFDGYLESIGFEVIPTAPPVDLNLMQEKKPKPDVVARKRTPSSSSKKIVPRHKRRQTTSSKKPISRRRRRR
ncbi:MAG: serine/threonine protein kinase [Planctomycetota bacterium]|jgi:serine/threonine-protein kinase